MLDFLILLQDPEVFGAGRDGNPWSGAFGWNWSEIITAVVTVLGPAVAGWWAHRKGYIQLKFSKEEKVEDLKNKWVQEILTDNNNLRNMYNSQQISILELKHEVKILKDELTFYRENRMAGDSRFMLSQILNTDDNPYWIHDLTANTWYVNDAFCKMFSVKRADFWTPVNLFARYPETFIAEYLAKQLSICATNAQSRVEKTYNKDILNPNCTYKVKVIVEKTPLKVGNHVYLANEIVEVLEDHLVKTVLEN